MSQASHVYTVAGTEATVIVSNMASALMRGNELTGEVKSVTPGYMVLTDAQNRAINTHGFVAVV